MKKLLICIFILLPCLTSYADETQIVAEVIGAEGCNQGLEGLQGVGNVIKNRAIRQGKTPYQIVTAKGQFFAYTNPRRRKIYLTCKKQADYVARNVMTLPDLTDNAEYFLLPGEPVRRWHGEKTVTILNHTFYKGK